MSSEARWVEVTQAVFDAISVGEFSQEFTLARNYADFELKLEMAGDVRVDVAPYNVPTTFLEAQGTIGFKVPVDVAVRYKFTPLELESDGRALVTRIDALCYFLQELFVFLCKLRLDSVNAVWETTEILQAYSPESLRERQQYTGLIRVTFDAPTP